MIKMKQDVPRLETERLILRAFTDDDIQALFEIVKDEEVNRFLPWHPVKTLKECEAFFEERFRRSNSYKYAICFRDNIPIGYVHVNKAEPYDFGYVLKKEFWHKGIVSEAGKAVLEQVKKDGIAYVTATHDINNPRSGSVMKRLGMKYQYSYEEEWQPKDILVTFRLYLLNLDGKEERKILKYWNMYDNHYVEEVFESFQESHLTDRFI